jgi:cell fate regulator YaaT (PSP1 superfamily)
MKNNKYKNKDKKEEEDINVKRGFIYLVKNQSSNEMTLCAFDHQLKKSQAVIYETRYGLDLGFVVSDASKIGQPYQSGNPNPCGCSCDKSCSNSCLETSNIEEEDNSDLILSSDDVKDEHIEISEEEITGKISEIYSDGDNTLENLIDIDKEEIKNEIEDEESDEEIFLFRDTSNTANCDDDECNKVEVSSDTIWIERTANKEDLRRYKELSAREDDALTLCREKIKKHKLEMKLVTAHFLLIEPKVVFFFTADVRVDFRDLVKDLVSIFRIRIELRQIGVRDESRLLGGLAVCGRDYCCHAITDKLSPVSIKMAKEQNLSLNSIKISGPCGRLLCCLSYEQNFYAEEKLKYPPEGSRLKIGRDLLRVSEVNILSKKITLLGSEGRMMTIDGTRVYFNTDSSFWVLEKDYIKELLSE